MKFTRLVILGLIIAVVLIIGGIWWYFYLAPSKAGDTKNAQTNSEPSPEPVPKSSVPSDPNEGYVVIKEWNVRFKPVEGLKDVMYSVGSRTGFDESVGFSTKALSQYGKECSSGLDGRTPLGVLTRSKTEVQEFVGASGEFVRRIDRYYYHYITPQAVCADNDRAADNLQLQTLNSFFKPSVTNLEAAQ